MDVTRSLIKLIIGGGCMVGGLAFPPLLAADGIVWGTILATALASVAAGNTANAIDALIDRKDGDRISLQNQDLTKAVGKAIAAVITLAALQNQGKTHDNLEKIASQATNNWVKIAQQELTQQRYPQLREAKLDQFLTPEEYSLTQEGNLTPQEWQDIFIRLNMAACKGGGFQLPPEVYPQVAELLHTTFPKALRETLKEDFAKDGKAFAGLTLQLLTGMKAELTQLRNTNLAVNTAELTQIIQEFQQLETQLRGTVAQQQAFFRQISQDIDSGFAEVCQQLGVMETNITTLLQNLEKRLDALDEKLTRLEAPRGRSLSKQEYRNRQNVLTQMRTEVESRLTQSIHRAAFVNLGKEQQPQQVQRPWDMSVKVGEQRSVQLPPQTTILDVFDNPTISGKFLILGKPGGGKTTTLLELAEALIERAEGDSDAPIPVILELSTWQEVTKRKFLPFGEREKYDPSIKEWVLSQLISKGVSQEIGEQWLREKELVLLLDGLDELQPERQGKCVRAINQFLGGEFSPLHLVVCSRKEEYEVYEEMLHLNGAICLEDLTNEQIRDYFTSVNLGEFWESIKGSEKIVDFIRQPLFLAVTSIAYQQIDVEEWRNCNTEERTIDYLLGVYRVERLTKKTPSRWYSSNNIPTHLITQNALNRLSRSMLKKQEKNFVVRNITLCLLESDLQIEYVNQISAFLIFFALFLPIVALIKPELYVAISVFLAYLFFAFYWRGKTEDQRMNIIVFLFVSTLCFLGVLSMMPMFFPTVEVGVVVIIIVTSVGMYLNHFLFYREDINLSFVSLKKWLDESKGMFLFERKPLDYRIPADLDEMVRRNEDDQQWGCLMFGFFCFGFLVGIFIANNLIKTNNLILSIIAKLAVATLAGIFVMLAVLLFLLLIVIFLFLAYSILVEMYNLCRRFVLRLILGFSGIMPWNITRFLDYCTERLILQRVGNRYRFIHRLVQEHFANLEIQKE